MEEIKHHKPQNARTYKKIKAQNKKQESIENQINPKIKYIKKTAQSLNISNISKNNIDNSNISNKNPSQKKLNKPKEVSLSPKDDNSYVQNKKSIKKKKLKKLTDFEKTMKDLLFMLTTPEKLKQNYFKRWYSKTFCTICEEEIVEEIEEEEENEELEIIETTKHSQKSSQKNSQKNFNDFQKQNNKFDNDNKLKNTKINKRYKMRIIGKEYDNNIIVSKDENLNDIIQNIDNKMITEEYE